MIDILKLVSISRIKNSPISALCLKTNNGDRKGKVLAILCSRDIAAIAPAHKQGVLDDANIYKRMKTLIEQHDEYIMAVEISCEASESFEESGRYVRGYLIINDGNFNERREILAAADTILFAYINKIPIHSTQSMISEFISSEAFFSNEDAKAMFTNEELNF